MDPDQERKAKESNAETDQDTLIVLGRKLLALQNSPDREAKIEGLRAEVEAGTYRVPNLDLARKIIRDAEKKPGR